MIKRITYFAPHKTALTVASVWALGSLLFIVPMAILMNFVPSVDDAGNAVPKPIPGLMLLLMPLLYFIFGYIGTAFSAWVYNKVARLTGGIQLEISE